MKPIRIISLACARLPDSHSVVEIQELVLHVSDPYLEENLCLEQLEIMARTLCLSAQSIKFLGSI